MVGIIRADGEVGPGLRDLMRGCCQNPGQRLPVVRMNVAHVLGQWHRVHGYLRVIMLTHDGLRLQTNRAVTQGSALGATSYDANVLGHCIFASASLKTFGNIREHLTPRISGAANGTGGSLRNSLRGLRGMR